MEGYMDFFTEHIGSLKLKFLNEDTGWFAVIL